MTREQALTRSVSIRSIVASRDFARGLAEVRNGLPFNPDNDEWDYERGRAFGSSRPSTCPYASARLTRRRSCSRQWRFLESC